MRAIGFLSFFEGSFFPSSELLNMAVDPWLIETRGGQLGGNTFRYDVLKLACNRIPQGIDRRGG